MLNLSCGSAYAEWFNPAYLTVQYHQIVLIVSQAGKANACFRAVHSTGLEDAATVIANVEQGIACSRCVSELQEALDLVDAQLEIVIGGVHGQMSSS